MYIYFLYFSLSPSLFSSKDNKTSFQCLKIYLGIERFSTYVCVYVLFLWYWVIIRNRYCVYTVYIYTQYILYTIYTQYILCILCLHVYACIYTHMYMYVYISLNHNCDSRGCLNCSYKNLLPLHFKSKSPSKVKPQGNTFKIKLIQ